MHFSQNVCITKIESCVQKCNFLVNAKLLLNKRQILFSKSFEIEKKKKKKTENAIFLTQENATLISIWRHSGLTRIYYLTS